MSLAVIYARNYFTIASFTMISAFAVFNWLMVSVMRKQPGVFEEDFVFYMVVNCILFCVFSFCFAYLISAKKSYMPMIMMGLCASQALMCFILIVNGGTFPSNTLGDVTFTFSDGVTSIVTYLNDIIWTVECVVVWIAAYTAKNASCFKG